MFDIGFWELIIIGILGLVVVGPERLPTAIRSVRSWINSVKNFSSNVQSELKEELRIHELHDNLKKAEQINMKNLSPELEESVQTLKEAADMVNRPFDHDYHDKFDDLDGHGSEQTCQSELIDELSSTHEKKFERNEDPEHTCQSASIETESSKKHEAN